jgi:hypothetical protein
LLAEIFLFDQKIDPRFVQPDHKEVEEQFWHLLTERNSHVQIQQGSGSDGYG